MEFDSAPHTDLSFNFSMFPILLELTVECTYPIDQTMSTALIFFSGSLQTVVLMAAETILHKPLSILEMKKQVCASPSDTSHEQAKDYSPYVIFISVYGGTFITLYCILFHPEMKRSNADKIKETDCNEEGNCLAPKDQQLLTNH